MSKHRPHKRHGLFLTLVRVGRSVSRGAESGRLRLVALCVATMAVTLSLAGFVVINATYEGRQTAHTERSPHIVPPSQKHKAIARWQDGLDTIDGEQYSIVFIEPLTDDAPPPPGLREWPKPGHSALSLGAEIQGADEGITSRFGPADGFISFEGLSSAGEPLAYVRPQAPMTSGYYVSGWGDEQGPVFGEPLYVQPAMGFHVLATATLLAPSLALVVIASRTGSVSRDRRRAVLHALGINRRHRLLIDLGEVLPAIVVGAALSAVSLWFYESTNWPLPKVDYVMTARFLAPFRAALYSCIGLAALLVVTAAVLLQPRVTGANSVRPAVRDRRTLLKTAAWLCPLAFAFAFFGPSMLGADNNEMLFLLPYSMGALISLLALPALLSLLTGVLGRGLARYGKRIGNPAALVAGRWVAASPAAVARVIVSVVMVMGVSAMLYTWNNRVTDTDQAAEQLRSQLAGSVVQVEGRLEQNADAHVAAFRKALPEGVMLLGSYVDEHPGSSGRLQLTGPRAALEQAGIPVVQKPTVVTEQDATTSRGRALIRDASENGNNAVQVVVGPVTTAEGLTTLQAVAPEKQKIAPSVVKHLANRHLVPGWTADPPGTEWTSSLVTHQRHSWWLVLFALVTVGLLAFTTCLANVAEFVRFGRSLAPVGVIAGSKGLFVRTALWVFFGAFTVAVTLGAAAAVVLTTPMLGPPVNAKGVPTALVASGMGVVTLVAVIMTSWSAWIAVREAGRWKPVGD